MLIEFSVANFKSIKEEACLNMTAGPGREHRETHLVMPTLTARSQPSPLVRTAVIFGANAAGKSNLLDALRVMKNIVRTSSQGPAELPVIPFKFDFDSKNQSTVFEVKCIVQGIRYQYGFSATKDRVHDEWLFAWPRGRVQTWFERDGPHWKLGDKLTGDKELWKRTTRPDALFLSTAVSLNSEQLRPLYDWFHHTVQYPRSHGWTDALSLDYCQDERKQAVIDFLHSADLGIADLRITKKEFSPDMLDMLPAAISVEMKEELTRGLAGKMIVEDLFLRHDTGLGYSTELEMEEESAGTQKIFSLAGSWLEGLNNGNVLVIDELDNSLHPQLVAFLVERFHDPAVNTKGAQLIFSTHDAALLSQDRFRRDQIWFCERHARQETHLYSLTDFRPRKDLENLERSYLAGRYGALPYTRPTTVLHSH